MALYQAPSQPVSHELTDPGEWEETLLANGQAMSLCSVCQHVYLFPMPHDCRTMKEKYGSLSNTDPA
jgi:hypothetical protein